MNKYGKYQLHPSKIFRKNIRYFSGYFLIYTYHRNCFFSEIKKCKFGFFFRKNPKKEKKTKKQLSCLKFDLFSPSFIGEKKTNPNLNEETEKQTVNTKTVVRFRYLNHSLDHLIFELFKLVQFVFSTESWVYIVHDLITTSVQSRLGWGD